MHKNFMQSLVLFQTVEKIVSFYLRSKEMERLLKILKEARPDFAVETKLIDDGILDSFDIITIVGEINEEFDININVGDLVPEPFNSAQAIWELIQTYLNV